MNYNTFKLTQLKDVIRHLRAESSANKEFFKGFSTMKKSELINILHQYREQNPESDLNSDVPSNSSRVSSSRSGVDSNSSDVSSSRSDIPSNSSDVPSSSSNSNSSSNNRYSNMVEFKCISVSGRLRVRITTPGYNNSANCSFPKNIRRRGAKYTAPASAVTFGRGPSGTFFYRVKRDKIAVLDSSSSRVTSSSSQVRATSSQAKVDKIYTDEQVDECVICLDRDKSQVFVPCGHYVCCYPCCSQLEANRNFNCPICRTPVREFIDRNEIPVN